MMHYRLPVGLVLLFVCATSLGFAQATQLAIPTINGGAAVTAGTPFSVTVAAVSALGERTPVVFPTGVTVSLKTGTSTLGGGPLTGTILAGMDSVVISGMTYTKAESIVLTATRTSGDILLAGDSGPFPVGPAAASKVVVETAADGTGVVVPAQSLISGATLTVYSIARDQFDNFVANVAADTWSLQAKTADVADTDLAPAGDMRSALFTARKVGTASIQATSGVLAAIPSGTLTVVAGPPARVRVETAANGTGTVVPAQSIASGGALTMYAILRDAADNFLENTQAESWSLIGVTGGVVAGDLVPAGNRRSATFTGRLVGTATVQAAVTGLTSIPSGLLTVTPGPATRVIVETAANGSGGAVPPLTVPAGSSITVFAVTRDAAGNFIANVAADGWSILSATGGVVAGDLVASGDSRSAVFTGHAPGTGRIQATSGGLTPVPTGTLTVSAGTATKVRVETAADGSGTVVPAQSLVSGSTLTVYAISRDASDNFLANVAATGWSLIGTTGGVVAGDLVPSGDGRSAVFAARRTGTAQIQATISGLAPTPSGILTVTPGAAAKVRVETAANGSGTVVPAQSVASGSTVTMYAVARDASDNFIANVAADAWSLVSRTGGVADADLVASGDSRSAVFTGRLVGTAAVQATSGALPVVPSGTLTVTGGPATRLVFGTQPGSTQAGATITPAVTVRIEDAAGNLVTGDTRSVTVALANNPTGAVLGGTKVAGAVGGVATFSTLTVDKVGTGYTLGATSTGGLTAATSAPFNITVGAATTIAAQSGGGQSNRILRPLASPFVVLVTDGSGNPVQGVTVGFAIAAIPAGATGQALSAPTVQTDASGLAGVSLTLGSKTGTYSVTATSGSLSGSPVTFNATATRGPAQFLTLVSGDNQSGSINTALGDPFVVAVTDSGLNPVPGDTVSFTIDTVPAEAVGQALSVTAGVTDNNGRASTVLTTGSRAGVYIVGARRAGLTGSPVLFHAAVGAGAASAIAPVAGNNQSGAVGSTLTAMTVRVTDAGGNPVSGVTVNFQIIGTPPDASGMTLTPASPVTGADGIAGSQLTLGNRAGQYTVQASAGTLSGSPVTFEATATPGAAGRLAVIQQPAASQTAGRDFAPAPQVAVQDGAGNVVTTDQDSIFAVLSTGAGSLGGVTRVRAVNGIATFPGLQYLQTGQIRVRFVRSGLQADSTILMTVGPDSAYQLVLASQPPATLAAGAVITPALSVQLRDRFGNSVARAGVLVTVSTERGPGILLGTTSIQTGAAGQASFADLHLNATGTYRLRAASAGLLEAITDTFRVVAGAIDTLVFTTNPSNSSAGQPFTTAPVVELRDRFGNVPAGSPATVTLALSDAGATLSGPAAVASDPVTGRATFPGLSVNRAGTYTLMATVAGLSRPGISAAFTITAGAPRRLVFVQEPTSTTAGVRVQPSVTVAVQDSFGNAVTSATVPVNLTLSGGGTLPGGMLTRLTSAGLAVFDSVIITAAGPGKQLIAVSATGGLTADTSVAFTVRPAAASRLLFSTQPGPGTAGVAFARQPAVTLQDQFGNIVTGSPQMITIALRDTATRGASLLGTFKSLPVDTATGRVAFTGLAVDKAGRGYTLTVTGTTVAPAPGAVVSDTFSITPAAASQVRVETLADGSGTLLGRQTVSSGTSITVYAVARDGFENYVGNIAPDAGGWGLTIYGGGVVAGDLVPAADRRSAVFTGHIVGQARITVAAGGLTGIGSDTLTVVQAGAASRIVVETADNGTGHVVPAQTVQSGRALRIYAIARDASNNFIGNVAADWSLVKLLGGLADSDLVASPDRRSALFTGHRVGRGLITASSATLAVIRSDTITVVPGAAARVLAVNGTSGQSAAVGTAFGAQLAAEVRDSSGNPVPGASVTFSAPVSGPSGTFTGQDSQANVLSNASGVATAPIFVANPLAGTYADTATVRGAASALFAMTNIPGAIRSFTLASTSGGTIGQQEAQKASPLSITARDTFGNAARSFNGTVDLSSNGSLVTGGGTTPNFTNGVLNPWPVAFAAAGRYVITARRTSGTEVGRTDTITVVNPAPTITSLTPSNGTAGRTVDVTISGSGFLNGVTVLLIGDSRIAVSTTVNSFTQMTARLSIDASIVPGPKDVTVANIPPGGGTSVLQNGFIVGNNPLPVLTSITPAEGQRYQTLDVGFRGSNFLPGSSTVSFAPGITVNSVKVDSGTHITANITITGTAALGAGQASVVNAPPGGGTSTSMPFTVRQETAAFPVLARPANGATGQPAATTLEWNAVAGADRYNVQVSKAAGFTPLVLDSTITGTSYQFRGQEYMAYYWRVRARQANGAMSGFTTAWMFSTMPATYAAAETTQFPLHTDPASYAMSDYRIVGLPGADSTSLAALIPGVPEKAWTAYWDNGADSAYWVRYGEGDQRFLLTAGRAFWVLHQGPWVVNANLKSAKSDTGGVRIRLHQGFNLITNPFPKAIPWSRVQTANGMSGVLFGFDGNWRSPVGTLTPYEGYYYRNTRNDSVLTIPYPDSTLPASPLGRIAEADSSWTVDIALERKGIAGDRATWFGTSPGASEGYDKLDFHKPRALGPIPQIFFERPAWDRASSSFASDIRPLIREVERWTLQVRVPGKEWQRMPHVLRFDGVGRIPDRFAAFLVDEAHRQFTDLRAASSYSFTPPGEAMGFSILIGDPDAVRRSLDEIAPKSFALDQNYPNPFNPTTTIAVNVPYASPVSVIIYNILGQEVRTIHAGPLEPGRYLFRWEGNNDHGSFVGTGVYLCRMTVPGGPTYIRKMLFLK